MILTSVMAENVDANLTFNLHDVRPRPLFSPFFHFLYSFSHLSTLSCNIDYSLFTNLSAVSAHPKFKKKKNNLKIRSFSCAFVLFYSWSHDNSLPLWFGKYIFYTENEWWMISVTHSICVHLFIPIKQVERSILNGVHHATFTIQRIWASTIFPYSCSFKF